MLRIILSTKKNINTLPKIVLDASISPQTALMLREMSFDVRCLIEEGLYALPDEKIAEMAKLENRIIITFDADFARMWYEGDKRDFGVIHVRIKDQFVDSVNQALIQFFTTVASKEIELRGKLTILRDSRFRILPL